MQLQKLLHSHLNQQSRPSLERQREKRQDQCKQLLQNLDRELQKHPCIDLTEENCAIADSSLSFLSKVVSEGYSFCELFTVSLNLQKNSMEVLCQLLTSSFSKVSLRTNDLSLILIRYFNGLNSVPSSNVIYLHTANKVITVRHSTNCFVKEFDQLLSKEKNSETNKYIIGQILEIKNRLKGALPQILFLCNQQPPERFKGTLPPALMCLCNVTSERDQSKATTPVRKNRQQIREDIEIEMRRIRFMLLDKIGIVQKPEKGVVLPQQEKQKITEEQKKRFYQHPKAKIQNQVERIDIMTRVQFRQSPPPRWDFFDETKFSRISVGNVYMMYVQPNGKFSDEVQKFMVKKERIPNINSNMSDRNRILQEHQILKKIAELQCINISRYYYRQKTKAEEIYSEFCGFRSLDKYKQSYQQTMSLLTKIFLLCHIVQGIRFLRQNQIIHCDIKAGNVLLSRNLTAKLCDLGDSVNAHKNGWGQTFATSLTPFFSGPEVYGKDVFPHLNLDVYSLGVLMFEMLFNRYPYQLSPGSSFQYHLNRKSVDFSELHKIMPGRLTNYGPQELLEYLADLCLLCFNKDPQLRPELDNILVVLRLSMNYLTKLF